MLDDRIRDSRQAERECRAKNRREGGASSPEGHGVIPARHKMVIQLDREDEAQERDGRCHSHGSCHVR